MVNENGCRHEGLSVSEANYRSNVEMVLAEDLALFDSSAYYAASLQGDMVGSLKVSLWDGQSLLPLEKIFDINCYALPFIRQGVAVWHVGRLAISKGAGAASGTLLKELLTLAIYTICQHPGDSVMVAECDSKLLRVLNLLGIRTMVLAPGVEYLGSETIPICCKSEWLRVFLNGNGHVGMISQLPGLPAGEGEALAEVGTDMIKRKAS